MPTFGGSGDRERPCTRCEIPTKEQGHPILCSECMSLWFSRVEDYKCKLQEALTNDGDPDLKVRILLGALVRRMESCIDTYYLLGKERLFDMSSDVIRSALETLLVFQECKDRGYDIVSESMHNHSYKGPRKSRTKIAEKLGYSSAYKYLSDIVHPTRKLYGDSVPILALGRSQFHHNLTETKLMVHILEDALSMLKEAVQIANDMDNREFTYELRGEGHPTSVEEAEERREYIISLAREEW